MYRANVLPVCRAIRVLVCMYYCPIRIILWEYGAYYRRATGTMRLALI